ncbi:MAG: hypothetical protein A3K19_11875 [Lentisphaerae bacterium RIFOXYB12_FULL_65_16]|nr:MAG: hypothetical protein A3K18_27145 [Lentisphaerae bacterium RIFOXYA12_64_32]OGV87959.1 MAG: hypothetical protein A3K19_11875 [Lentisphaerae bacterium RIFOXYB12_FULL_65_16]
MIRRKGTYETDERKEMRGGKGTVQIENYWKPGELKAKTRLLARLTLPPGTSIGFHEHAGEEEVFIVLRGQARAKDADREDILNVGDTILTGNGAGHAIESIGTEPLEMVAVIVKY